MAIISQVQRIIRGKVTNLQDEYEVWQADHKMAMAYFNFCDLVNSTLELYEDICRLDENWRKCVHRGDCKYERVDDAMISDLFHSLANVAFGIEGMLEYFDNNYGVEKAQEFGKLCTELRGIVTADHDFFEPDSLSKLRDEALDEFERGKCESWPA